MNIFLIAPHHSGRILWPCYAEHIINPCLMTELSKEYFDNKFAEVDLRFDRQTKQLKAYSDQQTEKLAAMVADGFEEVKELLDVRERVKQLESDMHKIKEALLDEINGREIVGRA